MIITPEQPKIVVVGSSSIDLVLYTDTFPKLEHTVIAHKSDIYFGGKGANQAIGTARLGASVYFVGCVGMDPYGQQVMRNLMDEGVNVGFVAESANAHTGTAYIAVSKGENAIVIIPAANHELSVSKVNEAEHFFSAADLILVQLEIPMEIVEHTVALAKKYHKKIGIYAAPAMSLSQEALQDASFIVIKGKELSAVFGETPREEVLKQYPNKLFILDDFNFTTYYDGFEMKYYTTDEVEVVDKIGMGDAFVSGLALAFCHGNSVDESVKFANEVSLRVAQAGGSQNGLPYLKDFQ